MNDDSLTGDHSGPSGVSRVLGRADDAEDGPDEVMDLSLFAEMSEQDSASEVEIDVEDDEEEDMDIDEESEEEEEEEEEEDDDDDSDDVGMYRSGALSSEGEFKGVEVLYPRKSYRGARNVETVKDCELTYDG